MVMQKYNTISELKSIKPVKEVVGRIVAGPFTLEEASNRAGIEVIKAILKDQGFQIPSHGKK